MQISPFSCSKKTLLWTVLLSFTLFSFDLRSECASKYYIIEQEDGSRPKTAAIVAGASIIALIGGVAALACCSSSHHKSHSSHHSHKHSSSRDSYDSYGHSHHSYSSYHKSHSHHSHHSSPRYSSNWSESSSSDRGSFYRSPFDPQILEREAEGNLPARCRRLPLAKLKKEQTKLSGHLVLHPIAEKGSNKKNARSFTAFVQLPNGSKKSLGSLKSSEYSSSSISFGPYEEKGEYLFGITFEGGEPLASSVKVATLALELNHATIESRDFYLSAGAKQGFEPNPLRYELEQR